MPVDNGLAAARAAYAASGGVGEEPARSPEWDRVKNEHLQKEPKCVCCGVDWKPGTPVQVHHIFPFHYCNALGRPDLELDERNLVTLCETESDGKGQNHHLLVGHLDDFEAANPESRTDARTKYFEMLAAAIRADPKWTVEVTARLPVLQSMTIDQKTSMRREMDQRMPAAPGAKPAPTPWPPK
jgi:hypothetical protein